MLRLGEEVADGSGQCLMYAWEFRANVSFTLDVTGSLLWTGVQAALEGTFGGLPFGMEEDDFTGVHS